MKERQAASHLSPVPEGPGLAAYRDSDTVPFLTPAVKKKRKLYSTTPQHSAVGFYGKLQ